jgi:homogentisate 1,2-dioxygenase
VLAVGAADGGNFVELVVFVPRFNLTTDKYPTYLPPYDHRNNGKSEIMHYLGGYDAREGSEAGYLTVATMGVAHGNDAATFNKARSGKNEILELKFPPATMLELTNSVKFSQYAYSLLDPTYMD